MNKKFLTLLMLASFLATPLSAVAVPGVNEVPQLNNSINGSVSGGSTGSHNFTDAVGGSGLNVTVGSGKANEVGQFDWNTFNLGANKRVNWNFTGISQTALNRVLDANPSQIYGKLTNTCANAECGTSANTSKVILINPNGLLFGPGSSVNLNSFTASTYDLKGAKNIKDMTASELQAYTNNIDRNFGPDIKVTFQSTTDKIGSLIKMDGANVHADKSLIVLAKDIEVQNGSVLSTTVGYNYALATDNPQSFSNVKLIAADGAEAIYQKNGYVNNADINGGDAKAGVDYTIKMDSTGAKNEIKSGNVFIRNKGTTDNSNIDIKKTNIESQKLVNKALGDVVIWAENKTNIADSGITTINTYEVGNQANKNTYAQDGGQVRIYGGKGIDIKSTKIVTAHSVLDNGGGDVTILSDNGDISITNNSEINSLGNVKIEALKSAKVADTTIIAANRANADSSIGGQSLAHLTKDLLIRGHQGTTTLENAKVAASGNTTIDAATTNTIKGSSVYAAKNLNVYAGGTTAANAGTTLIENSRLGYNNLSLYKTGQINNVTVKGDTTFDDRGVTDGSLTLTASGSFTADNATLKNRSLTFTNNATSRGLTSGSTIADHTAVTLNSNTSDVSFINHSDVKATQVDITANALNGSVKVLDSKLDAKRDVVLNAKNSFTTGTNINAASSIKSGRSIIVNVNGAGQDIVLDRPVLDKLDYNNRLKLTAAQDVKLTSTMGLNVDRVDMTAGRNNEVSARGAINFSHSILKADNGENKIVAGNMGGVNFDTVAATSKNGTTVTATGAITTSGDDKGIDMKNTKLILTTPGDINMSIANSNGLRAEGGVVNLKAVNGSVGYPGSPIDRHSRTLTPTGPRAGATLSIDKIVADRLYLDSTNNKFAAVGEKTIEVKEYGGFNLDPKPEFVYNDDGTYNTYPFYKGSTDQGLISTGVDGYKKHEIDILNDGNKFTLIYERPTIDCPPEPPVIPDDSNDYVRLPLQTAFTSQGQIVNNLTDATANIVAAAAGIVLTDEMYEDEYTLETY